MNGFYFRLLLCFLASISALDILSGQCTTDAGTMTLTPVTVCGDTLANAIHNGDAVLDGNDALIFILHDNSGSTLGNVFATYFTPSFEFQPGMTYGVTYYISAVGGDNDGIGNVNLNDPCLSVAPGTPVVFNQPVLVGCNTNTFSCAGMPVTPICTVSGEFPLTYQWTPSAGVSDPTILNPVIFQPGTYLLEVTGANGCTASSVVVVFNSPPLICDVEVQGMVSCSTQAVVILAPCTGGGITYTYQWADPNGVVFGTGPIVTVVEPGEYTLTVTDNFGCTYTETVTVLEDNQECGAIIGAITEDDNDNCFFDPGEASIGGWLVKATGTAGEEFYGYTDSTGNYDILALPGTYLVEAIPPYSDYWQSCEPPVAVTLADANDVDTVDFHLEKLVDCPLLEVDISTPMLRRCFNNTFYVNYCNLGTATAEDAYVEVTLDPLIILVDASIPWSGPVGNTYTFDVGDVAVGDCGNFTIATSVSCSAILGQTLCAEAHIFPDSLCFPVDPAWPGAEIQITSECTADSVVFTITNVGTGNMDEPSQFIVVEDGVMLMADPQTFQLNAGESFTVSYPANGSTYVLLADQVEGTPGFSSPLSALEGCGTNGSGAFSLGIFTQFPEDDADPFLSMDCHEVIGSYDPNDKNGFPKGYGDEHQIEPGQELEYHVRFQNTGTDTAFNVIVQDVLSPYLDISTLRPGATSHPYDLEILGSDTLRFVFHDIMLPDSNVNEPGSHGFIKFRIGQKANLPLGTVIENNAAIFFDLNEPVVTNTTFHKVDEHVFPVPANESPRPELKWAVFPNPFSETATIVLQGNIFGEAKLLLYDLTGRLVKTQSFTGNFAQIQKGSFSQGLYFYEIKIDGRLAGNGKLAVK